MEKSSSLGMPISPQEIFKRYKHQSLGMPQHPLFINKSIRSSFNALYFYCFIYYVLFLERHLFLFSVCFVLFSVINGWILAILFGRETRSAFSWNTLVLHLYLLSIQFSHCLASSSWFLCISCSELLVLLKKVLSCFTYTCLESYWNKLIGVGDE